MECVPDAQSVGKKLPMRPCDLMPRNKRLVTHADIQGQLASGFPAVLDIGAIEVRAGVEELARRLRKLIDVSKQKTGDRVLRVVGIEGEVARLPIQIVHIDLADLAVKAKRYIVVAEQDMDVVSQRVIGSAEKALRIRRQC